MGYRSRRYGTRRKVRDNGLYAVVLKGDDGKGDVKVEAKKDVVVVTGNDREEVGQASATIELGAKVKGYDKRVFQDGIHLIQKTSPIEPRGEGE